ncbi:20225_t:CDS:2 [Funneliformis geosporum]|nr:20225_t:CDS:2 [Funneliformis geosporum]
MNAMTEVINFEELTKAEIIEEIAGLDDNKLPDFLQGNLIETDELIALIEVENQAALTKLRTAAVDANSFNHLDALTTIAARQNELIHSINTEHQAFLNAAGNSTIDALDNPADIIARQNELINLIETEHQAALTKLRTDAVNAVNAPTALRAKATVAEINAERDHLIRLIDDAHTTFTNDRTAAGNNAVNAVNAHLKSMDKLEGLSINNTDFDSGLEHLPSSLVFLFCSADERPQAKVKLIEQELAKYGKPKYFNYAGCLML